MGASISAVTVNGMEGVAFVCTGQDGVQRRFVVSREGLEDVEYEVFESPESMLQAFGRHQAQVAQAAERALAAGSSGDPIVLHSLL